MADFVMMLNVIGQGIGLVKELNDVNKHFDEATLKLKIAELSGVLASTQIALSELQVEMNKKDQEINRLKSAFAEKSELTEHDGFQYRRGPDGLPRGRLYCPVCLAKGELLMTIEAGDGTECPSCKKPRYYGNIFGF
jgi:rubrerythrin